MQHHLNGHERARESDRQVQREQHGRPVACGVQVLAGRPQAYQDRVGQGHVQEDRAQGRKHRREERVVPGEGVSPPRAHQEHKAVRDGRQKHGAGHYLKDHLFIAR